MYTYKKMYVNTYTYVFTHMCILYIYMCIPNRDDFSMDNHGKSYIFR